MSKKLLDKTEVFRSKIVPISKLEGSKGSAGFVMTIESTTIAFVSSHFPVKSVDYRSLCFRYVDEGLGRGLGNKLFSLYQQVNNLLLSFCV